MVRFEGFSVLEITVLLVLHFVFLKCTCLYQVSLNPVQIFKAGADEEKAETARLVKYF